ncbi:Sulfite exporter TauE/SafE [Bacillus sp. OV194]|nr:Sulfite exporter TauE/SafE [Bacillus sp. OV194]
MVGGGLGSFYAHLFSDFVLTLLFAFMAVSAAITMIFPAKNLENDKNSSPVSKGWSVLIGFITGIIGGLIGLGAGFIFVPVILYIYKTSLRKAIGSSLVTCFLVVSGGLIAKQGMQKVNVYMVLFLVIGGIIGAQIGGRLNKFIQTQNLKRMVAIVIVMVSIKTIYDLF